MHPKIALVNKMDINFTRSKKDNDFDMSENNFSLLSGLATEKRNAASENIDEFSTIDVVRLINDEDKKVADAITPILPNIAKAVDIIAAGIASGGRLIYCGAGTSGRLGVLDAAECPPTFGVSQGLVTGIIAGGRAAMFEAQEGAEDSPELGATDLKKLSLTEKDIVVGIAASGRTPYVIGALSYARSLKSKTIAVSCSPDSPISRIADIALTAVTGPEIITGSTRMKAGTAEKMILNMLSTGTMIKLGKTYGNLMVDLKATNKKLVARAKNIVMSATGCTMDESIDALAKSNGSAKKAIFIILTGTDADKAAYWLSEAKGHLGLALKLYNHSTK